MTNRLMTHHRGLMLLALALSIACSHTAQSAVTDISTVPLSTYSATASTDVKPNVFMVVDDSGSMDWDYMPDNAANGTTDQFNNVKYNGLAYSPAIYYKPPVKVDSNGNLGSYPSMDGSSTSNGAANGSLPNWGAVPQDGYGVQTTSKTNLTPTATSTMTNGSAPVYYTSVAGEYCTNTSLHVCTTASAPTGNYTVPAYVRWCDTAAMGSCKAGYDAGTNANLRMPAPVTSTLSITGSSNAIISGITVDGKQILGNLTLTTATASSISWNINQCTYSTVNTQCTVVGYSAIPSGNNVIITAPTATNSTPVITFSTSGATVTASAFTGNSVPGYIVRNTITGNFGSSTLVNNSTSMNYPNKTTNPARVDCAATVCTFAEEMTNYANWYAYYRTRILMLKTAASNAFATIDTTADIAAGRSRFRLGLMTINNNNGSDFLNLGEFANTQKGSWYSKLTHIKPNNNTPLRTALATAGQMYAGKLNGTLVNGVTVTDPLQYSCQRNFTIMSTDGYWNSTAGTQLDGQTAIGNQDGGDPPPYGDGGTTVYTYTTSTLQTANVGTLYQYASSTNNGNTWGRWKNCSGNQSTCPTNTTKTIYKYQSIPGATGTYSNATGPCTTSATVSCKYSAWSGPQPSASQCIAVPQSTGPTYTALTARQCQITSSGGTSDTLADVAAYYYKTDLRNAAANANTGLCVGPTIAPSTTPNNLCAGNVPVSTNSKDVATYTHMTTFTLGLGAVGKMVYSPPNPNTSNSATSSSFPDDASLDFLAIHQQQTADPTNGICSWQTSGVCAWPTPASDSNANVDDLWHAAINGHGSYFSAKDPLTLSSGLGNVLSQITQTIVSSTSAAASSSNPNVSSSDNYVFSSTYLSTLWVGDLVREQIDNNAQLSAPSWSAQQLLDCLTTAWKANTQYAVGASFRYGTTCYNVVTTYVSSNTFDQAANGSTPWDTSYTAVVSADAVATPTVAAVVDPVAHPRVIYTRNTDTTQKAPLPFLYSSLNSTQQSYFNTPYISYNSATQTGLSQFCSTGTACLSSANQTAAAGQNLVNFLRGDRTNEGTYFRTRANVLGDIVSSEARYVKGTLFNYADAGYSTFASTIATRAGTVYVGANDGMVHAFDAVTGLESWAYIPALVLPNIYQLADTNYAQNHQYFVDNTPETGDVCLPGPTSTICNGASGEVWKTILVGGLNRGGKGYYALDVTDPAHPLVLWEFTDTNMSYSYGNPKITKLADGTWVVLLTSGYNNTDGLGHLYVLNAYTGALLHNITTTAGSATAPSGLARITAYALAPLTNNTVVSVYGGDLLGNVWRFDPTGASGTTAQLIVQLKDAKGAAQPITSAPVATLINGKPVIYVGTGQFLGLSDITTTQQQSYYAIADTVTTTPLTTPRSNSGFIKQALATGTCPSGASLAICTPGTAVITSANSGGVASTVDWTNNNGWYIDFPNSGERNYTDATLALGTILFTTNSPTMTTSDPCGTNTNSSASAGANEYALNYLNGGAVPDSSGVMAVSLGNVTATRPVLIELPNGRVISLTRLSTTNSNAPATSQRDVATNQAAPPQRRVSWRELTNQ